MLLFMEGLVMCFVLLLTCTVAIANGPVGGVALYEEDVQKRVVELGYTTKEQIRTGRVWMSAALFLPLFTLVPLMVYGINGADSFFSGLWQMTVILWIMGVFDRLFIDGYWVGRTQAWVIPGTEDLMPYIPKRVLVRKWIFTVLGFPVIAAGIAGIMTLL